MGMGLYLSVSDSATMRKRIDMATTDDAPKKPATKSAAKPAAKPATKRPAVRKAAPAKAPAAKAVATKATATKATATKATAAKAKKPATKAAAKPARGLQGEAQNMFGKVKTSARDAAASGKDRATSALSEVSAMVGNVAGALDDKVGPQYGDYARKAADAVSGLADSLKSKDIDDLLDQARTFVRTRPAVAIGAAAALGFVLTRIVRAGDDKDA
jgi:ElaB/YqjD/DUF883 family membrane-anchored ribosome-binding protein